MVEQPHLLSSVYCVKSTKKKKKQIMKKMHTINNQYPSTLALLLVDDVDFRLSCRSSDSKDNVEEQVRGGRNTGRAGLVGETEYRALEGGDGEKLNLGAGVMIPLRLGDFDICFPAILAGSCRG